MMVSSHGYRDVTRQIKADTGWSVGDYIVNYIVDHYSGKWVFSRAIMHDIHTAAGYKLDLNQISNTMARWNSGAYRTDGLLEKDKHRRGTYRWLSREALESKEPLDEPAPILYPAESEYIPVKDFLGEVKSGARARVVLENPAKKYKTMDHDTDGIMIVTSIAGGYLIKIDGHLYTAKKLDI